MLVVATALPRPHDELQPDEQPNADERKQECDDAKHCPRAHACGRARVRSSATDAGRLGSTVVIEGSEAEERVSTMAGGMSRRGVDRASLHERIHGTPPPAEENSPPVALVRRAPTALRHCWVTDERGRLPGLLIEWRRTVSGWQGRVVRPVLKEAGWLVVEEWLPSEVLERG
jgi:hypothetical protein